MAERLQAEEALRKLNEELEQRMAERTEAGLRALFAAMNDVIIVYDAAGGCLSWQRRWINHHPADGARDSLRQVVLSRQWSGRELPYSFLPPPVKLAIRLDGI